MWVGRGEPLCIIQPLAPEKTSRFVSENRYSEERVDWSVDILLLFNSMVVCIGIV